MKKIETVFVESVRDSKDGFFGGVNFEDEINGKKLAESIEAACNQLIANGQSIENILPIASGGSNLKGGAVYGYTYTSGVIIVASSLLP